MGLKLKRIKDNLDNNHDSLLKLRVFENRTTLTEIRERIKNGN